jgi:DNA-binding CsgD family transcriptional regulator
MVKSLHDLQQLEHDLHEAASFSAADQLLTAYLKQLGINAFAFTFYTRHPSSVNKIKYDYASEPIRRWHDYYLEQKYNDFDQTVADLHVSLLPLCWNVHEQLRLAKSETERIIRQESIEFGIDRGACIPLFGPHSHYASVVLYQMKHEQWLQDFQLIKYDLMIAANLYFNFVLEHLHQLSSDETSIQLTTRERQCLLLTAQQFSANEIAEKLKMTKRTADFHINNLNKKLGTQNKYQSLNKAIELGLVNL